VPVSRLTLSDFRSYASASIEPGRGFVLLTGDNGAGKTNLLEALSMLTPGRGLRGAATLGHCPAGRKRSLGGRGEARRG
jgi:Recombinational DNA repair ATPase (RecF pathway)